jgi:Tol biopolymer transport system component
MAAAGCGELLGPEGTTPDYALVYERVPSAGVVQTTVFVMPHQDAASVPLWPGTELTAAQPRASEDGRWIAFMAPATGSADDAVWIASADGTQRRQVFTSADALQRPAPSPDGSRIAFVRYDAELTSSRIWVVNADGTDARAVTTASHDGSFIYTAPAWSPDGNRLAFAMGAPGSLRIATMPAAGGTVTVFAAPAAGSDTEPAFSPSGSSLAFVNAVSPSQGTIQVVQLASGARRTVSTDNGRQPAWSPDGLALVYSARTGEGSTDLYFVDAVGGTPVRLTFTDVGERHPSFVREPS